jgi:CheY-like chemotaxis protein
MKILIVEDNEINMIVIEAMLNKCGNFSIYKAVNGKDAIDIYQKENPQYIFMDIQMPVMNGFDAVKAIRKLETGKGNTEKVRIIATTAFAADKDRQMCLSSGMDDYLSKPFTLSDVKNALLSSR